MQIPVKRAIERVPGGMMVAPLLAGSLIATFAPGTPSVFGSFTGALFTGGPGAGRSAHRAGPAVSGDGRWLILADDLTGAADCAIASPRMSGCWTGSAGSSRGWSGG